MKSGFFNSSILNRSQRIIRFAIVPIILYLLAFAVLTFPLLLQFNSEYFTDRDDGYQMVWDLWWVRYAVVDLHQWTMQTNIIHYPGGTSLWLHSLGLINGLVSIPVRFVFSDIQTFNLLVIFAFVGSGMTAFWLCLASTRRYWPSIAGGFSFAFCSYRWAHYFGHLPLMSTQWMPLFLLLMLWLGKRPRIVTAVAAAVTLLTVLLIDPYQFMDCMLVTALIVLWCLGGARFRRKGLRRHLLPAMVFLIVTASCCGPILRAMIRQAHPGAITGVHDADHYSADLLGPWVPDWTWAYSEWTRAVWGPLQYSYEEKSVCLGPAVVIAAALGLLNGGARRLRLGTPLLFAVIAAVFILLSFGPTWRIWTIPITRLTPYRLLMTICPSIQFAGSVGRMIIVAQLAISVLAARGLGRLGDLKSRAVRNGVIVLFAAAFLFEAQPRTLMTLPPDVPKWVEALRDDPRSGAVINLVNNGESIDLFYQTVHHRPIAGGALSRISEDVQLASAAVLEDVKQKRYAALAQEGFGFLVTGAHDESEALPTVYSDRGVRVYRLESPLSPIPLRQQGQSDQERDE